MAKQIIVTQNDYGIELETQFLDDKKKPLDITGYDVWVKVIYDDKTIDTVFLSSYVFIFINNTPYTSM